MDNIYLIANNFTGFINGLCKFDEDDQGNEIRRFQDGTVKINGHPDCIPHAKISIEIKKLTCTREKDVRMANKVSGLQETPDDWTWHHVEDGKTMQLIPYALHKGVEHTGSSSKKSREKKMINNIKVVKSHKPTNLEEIEKFEHLIQAKLPGDYKQFLLKHNGGHPLTATYKLNEPINAKNDEISVDWFYALYDGDVSNITTHFQQSYNEILGQFLPIADQGAGKLCLGVEGEDYGKLYYWVTNWSFWNEDDLNYLYFVSNSFTDFINGLYEKTIQNNNIIRCYQDGTVTIEPLQKHE